MDRLESGVIKKASVREKRHGQGAQAAEELAEHQFFQGIAFGRRVAVAYQGEVFVGNQFASGDEDKVAVLIPRLNQFVCGVIDGSIDVFVIVAGDAADFFAGHHGAGFVVAQLLQPAFVDVL